VKTVGQVAARRREPLVRTRRHARLPVGEAGRLLRDRKKIRLERGGASLGKCDLADRDVGGTFPPRRLKKAEGGKVNFFKKGEGGVFLPFGENGILSFKQVVQPASKSEGGVPQREEFRDGIRVRGIPPVTRSEKKPDNL